MRKLILAALVAGLTLVPVASAGAPYSFSNRTVFEKSATKQFQALSPKLLGARFTVRSIGCANAGVGRRFCAVVASNSVSGTRRFVAAIVCPSDSGYGCTLTISRGGF